MHGSLSGFDYKAKFKKGNENGYVGCLSRAPSCQRITNTGTLINGEVNHIYSELIFQISSTIIAVDIIAKETMKDPEFQGIIKSLQSESEG